MANSLLFIPDISGFTNFVNNTEIEHSQHVISELLEVLINANKENMELAEIEGDALFFYKHNDVPSQEKLLAQIETMFTAFYEHLQYLESYRICPCNACKTAPQLELKIIAHSQELQFIEVVGKKKPFGPAVIEVHRLLKNNVPSDSYSLITKNLADEVQIHETFKNNRFEFIKSSQEYDSKSIDFLYSILDKNTLNLANTDKNYKFQFQREPDFLIEIEVDLEAEKLYEFISNFKYRHHWNDKIDELLYKQNEVNKLGTQHACVVNKQHLDFTTITKMAKDNEFIYGETTSSPAPFDSIYQFYIITPKSNTTSTLKMEVFVEAKSIFKKLLFNLIVKHALKKQIHTAISQIKENAPKIVID